MLIILGLAIALAGVGVVATTVVRALPRIPAPSAADRRAAHESALKERLLAERIARGIRRFGEEVQRRATTSVQGWGNRVERGYRRLRLLAQEYTHVRPHEVAVTCETAIRDAETATAAEDYGLAEERYLACLKVDAKHRGAYLGLARLYRARKEDTLAEETLRFLRKLAPDDADVAHEFSVLLRDRGKATAAFREAQAAVALAPRNPKLLDFAIESAIIAEKTHVASKLLDQLREANPENQKLVEFGERIAAIAKV